VGKNEIEFDLMNIKVLLCSPFKGNVGGISRWTGHILNYYDANKQSFNIDLDLFSISRTQKIQANTFLIKRLILGFIDYLAIILRFVILNFKKEFDIVHLVSSGSFGLIKDIFILIISKLFSLKVIIHFRFGRIPDLYMNKNWEYLLLRIVFNLADVIIVIDRQTYDIIKAHDDFVLEYLPNPVAPQIQHVIENSKIVRSNNTILFAGHVIPTKGIFELVNATLLIPDIRVRIVGYYSLKIMKELEKLIVGHESKYVFLGEKSFDETIQEMLGCTVFVLPTYTEGFPNVILESMACSCPIITTSVGAIPEMLDINTVMPSGVVVTPKDQDTLSLEILKMIQNTELQVIYGERARIKVMSNYSIEIVWNNLLTIWERLQK